jgi:hypothetical protein
MATHFLENLGIFRIWHRNNPISGTPMFSSMMPSQRELCAHKLFQMRNYALLYLYAR